MKSTFEEYATVAISQYIKDHHKKIPDSILKNVASRISKKKKSHFGLKQIRKLFPDSYTEIWDEVKEIERNEILVLSQSILELEILIQRIGSLVFDCLKFQLATFPEQVKDLKKEVIKIKNAHKLGNVRVLNLSTGETRPLSKKWKMKLEVGIDRSKELQLLRKPVEGIVFTTSSGERRKLTGMFTAIHRLTGLFKFPLQGEKIVIS